MSGIRVENRKTLMLFSGRSFPELADEIGKELGVEPTPTEIYEFASGELFVRYKESVRGSDAFVIQSMATPINTWVMETLIMVDALKRGEGIEIRGFGSFTVREYKSYEGRNPRTGSPVHVSPKRLPFFKVGKELRERVNESARPARRHETRSAAG